MDKTLNLTQRDKIILAYFANKQSTVPDAAKELGIAYQTLIRYTRKLENAGYLMEVGFRKDNKRTLTLIRNPDEIPKVRPEIQIFFQNKLQNIASAINSITPSDEVPVRQEILIGLLTMVTRSESLAAGETSPGGMSPTQVAAVFKRIQAKLTYWVELIDVLLNSGIWIDDAENHKRIGLGSSKTASEKALNYVIEFERRYMGEDKGALQE